MENKNHNTDYNMINNETVENSNNLKYTHFDYLVENFEDLFIGKKSAFELIGLLTIMHRKIYELYYSELNYDKDVIYISVFLYDLISFLEFYVFRIIKTRVINETNEVNNSIKDTNITDVLFFKQELILLILDLFIYIGERENNSNTILICDKIPFFVLDEYSKNLINLKKGNSSYIRSCDYKNFSHSKKVKLSEKLNNIIQQLMLEFLKFDLSYDNLLNKTFSDINDFLICIEIDSNFYLFFFYKFSISY